MGRCDNPPDTEFNGDEFGNEDDGSPLSEEEIAYWDRPIWEVLGIKHEFAPEDRAPPIDIELLCAFAREQLSKADQKKVYRLLWTFQSWYDSWAEVQNIPGLVVPPWERRPSIYEHIQAHIHRGHLGLIEGGEVLPDAMKFGDDPDFDLPGEDDELESLLSHSERPIEIFKLVQSYCERPTCTNKSDRKSVV